MASWLGAYVAFDWLFTESLYSTTVQRTTQHGHKHNVNCPQSGRRKERPRSMPHRSCSAQSAGRPGACTNRNSCATDTTEARNESTAPQPVHSMHDATSHIHAPWFSQMADRHTHQSQSSCDRASATASSEVYGTRTSTSRQWTDTRNSRLADSTPKRRPRARTSRAPPR